MFSIISSLIGSAAIGAIWLLKKQQQSGKKVRRSAMVAAGVVFLIAASVFIAGLIMPERSKISNEDRDLLFAAHGYVVGKQISGEYKNGSVVMLVPEPELEATRGKWLVEAVKSGLGHDAGVTVLPVTPALSYKYTVEDCPPFTDLVRAEDYNKMLEQYQKAECVIFVAQLPKDAGKMKLWRASPRPKVFVLNGNKKLDPILKNRLISGYTALNDKADLDSTRIPRNYEAAFKSRFVMVTSVD